MARLLSLLAVAMIANATMAMAEEIRWGAIALGGNGFGAARGRGDETLAVASALRQCEESGGAGECRVRLTYRNQCTAYANGNDRQVGVAYAATIEQATKLALRSCLIVTRNCKVRYAACSTPDSFN